MKLFQSKVPTPKLQWNIHGFLQIIYFKGQHRPPSSDLLRSVIKLFKLGRFHHWILWKSLSFYPLNLVKILIIFTIAFGGEKRLTNLGRGQFPLIRIHTEPTPRITLSVDSAVMFSPHLMQTYTHTHLMCGCAH